MKVRPLCQVSDFVRAQAPQEFEQPTARLVGLIAELLDGLSDQTIASAMTPEHRLVATLDLKMLEAWLIHSNLTPPERLVYLVDRFSGDELPVLLYEEIIISNPVDDLRTFTRGPTGETEAVFYNEHRLTEVRLERVIAKVQRAINLLLDPGYVNLAADALDTIEEDLRAIIVSTGKLGRMPKEHFGTFRVFLNVHPLRNLKGPSGAFSARMPLLELLLRGDELPAKFIGYLQENRRYLPQQDREAVAEAVLMAGTKPTLSALWRRYGEPENLAKRINMIHDFFESFRNMHYRAVKTQLPDAITGKVAGTGGETDVGAFLRERMNSNPLN